MYTGILISAGSQTALIPMERVIGDFVAYEAGREDGDYNQNSDNWHLALQRDFGAHEELVIETVFDQYREEYAREFLGIDTADVTMEWQD